MFSYYRKFKERENFSEDNLLPPILGLIPRQLMTPKERVLPTLLAYVALKVGKCGNIKTYHLPITYHLI